jgi:hypothetical protein
MNKDNNPSCPGCSQKMTRAVVEKKWNSRTSSDDRHESVWLCDPNTGGCATTMPRILGRRR